MQTNEKGAAPVQVAKLKRFSLKELEAMKRIDSGHFDDLKYKDANFQVWLSRMTIADGAKYNNEVTVNKWDPVTYSWVKFEVYQAK